VEAGQTPQHACNSGENRHLMSFARYAIYWAPEARSALADFGKRWLGGDPETGARIFERQPFGIDGALVERATRSPRRYGLHATIKAPFRLAPDCSEVELGDALASFCSMRRQVRSGPLRLHRFGRYLALVPSSPCAGIEWLEAECVTFFDRFRAPLSDADRARRGGNSMSPLEAAHFEQFGYPHILSLFLCHVTLAGPLDDPELAEVEAALAPCLAAYTADEFVMKELCLFGDPGADGLFRIVRRCPLRFGA
jgi:hypothetical protein